MTDAIDRLHALHEDEGFPLDALAHAMADAGYADPDPVDQWVLPDSEAVARGLTDRGYAVRPVALHNAWPAIEAALRAAEGMLVDHEDGWCNTCQPLRAALAALEEAVP